MVSAYPVGLGGLLLLGGRAADRLGAHLTFVTGLALYGIASLAGGLAAESWDLVASRVVQGTGGALLTPATLTLIYQGFAEGPERNRALGAWGMAGSFDVPGAVLTTAGSALLVFGLAALVTCSPRPLDGLHTAGWTAAAITVADGLAALTLQPARTRQQPRILEGATK